MSPVEPGPVPAGPLLLSPRRLRSLSTRNRIVVSPMCQYASRDGGPTDWHLVHLGKFALGGAGIVFGEETAVAPDARKTTACAGIYDPAHLPAYRRIASFIETHGAIPAMQLGHAGGKAACRPPWEGFRPLDASDAARGEPPWRRVSASAVPTADGRPVPDSLDREGIEEVVGQFARAARMSLDAGFRIIEIHGAHGYLIHQFLSPIINRRSDGYGGDRAGRMRLALEITEAVRAVVPDDLPLFFRVSAVDGAGGHWDVEDTIVLAEELAARGVDVVDCSSGGITGPLTMSLVPRVPGYQVPYAAAVRMGAGVATMAVGMITEPVQAEAILAAGQADLIALARELMADPNWPQRAARELGGDPRATMPASYAWWLKRREEIRALGGDARPDEVPLRRAAQ